MQTNAMLRKRSFQLFWQNKGILLILFLLFAFMDMLLYLARVYLIKSDALEIILNMTYLVVMAPVMVLGMYRLMLHMINGGEVRWSMILDYIKNQEMFRKALLIGLVWQLPSIILGLPGLFMPDLIRPEMAIALLVAVPIAAWLFLWAMLRLFMLPYLFAAGSMHSVPEMVKDSFHIMKGQGRHLLWFGITVSWWGIVLAIGTIQLVPALSFPNQSATGPLLRQLFITLFLAFVKGYIYLALAGFANRLLPSAKEEKKARRKAMRAERNA